MAHFHNADNCDIFNGYFDPSASSGERSTIENQMNKPQVALGIVAAFLSWYGMMAVHEVGHCLGAIATGAKVDAVVIPPVGISRTDFSGSTWPVVAVWAGPVFGALAPLVLLAPLGFVGRRMGHVLRFFVGFCLVANGAYIGGGAFLPAGDCRELLRHGASPWQLVAFGLVATGSGLYVWHRMGPVREWFAVDKEPERQNDN